MKHTLYFVFLQSMTSNYYGMLFGPTKNLKFLEDIRPFCGATDTPALVMSIMAFKGQGPSPACNEFLRFTPDADLLAASMAAEQFDPHKKTRSQENTFFDCEGILLYIEPSCVFMEVKLHYSIALAFLSHSRFAKCCLWNPCTRKP